MKRTSRFLSLIFLIALIIFTLTFSIGLPIYVRQFYYAHVDALDLADKYGMDRQDIIDAYDEVLDFLTKEGHEFGTGVLPYSEEGMSHFVDCKMLFDLNKYAFLISVSLIVLLFLLDRIGLVRLARPFGLPLYFFAGVLTLVLVAVLGVLIAQNFSVAFTIFHKLFFPGKSNWLFDPYEDPIILFMPSQFFMDCAILIGASVLLVSLGFIISGIRRRYIA